MRIARSSSAGALRKENARGQILLRLRGGDTCHATPPRGVMFPVCAQARGAAMMRQARTAAAQRQRVRHAYNMRRDDFLPRSRVRRAMSAFTSAQDEALLCYGAHASTECRCLRALRSARSRTRQKDIPFPLHQRESCAAPQRRGVSERGDARATREYADMLLARAATRSARDSMLSSRRVRIPARFKGGRAQVVQPRRATEKSGDAAAAE